MGDKLSLQRAKTMGNSVREPASDGRGDTTVTDLKFYGGGQKLS